MNQNSKYKTLAALVLSLGLTACGDETTVSVTDHSGMAISNATVSMNGESVQTDNFGKATIKREDARNASALSIEAEGYINQSVQIDAISDNKDDKDVKNLISATLKIKNPIQKIENIAESNQITSADGSIFVNFTPNSFVKADGNLATGKAEVSITQWNPKNINDMAAFLGDGYAQDSQGSMGQLVSYGAMTVEFSQNGEKLQLVDGKKATISMPLSLNTHYDSKQIAVGDSIPMWHFATDKGYWLEEGQGNVVQNADGNLVLTADVAHFTTWNWDMMSNNPATVSVKCQLPDGTAVACTINANITYNNGASTKTKQMRVPKTGADMVRLDPNLDSMTFEASYLDEEGNKVIGSFASNGLPSNDVVVVLDKILASVNVKCELSDGTAVDCELTTAIIDGNGNATTTTQASQIASTGEKLTGLDPELTNIDFKALFYDKDGNKVTGSFTSNSLPNNDVVVVLDQVGVATVTVPVECQLPNGMLISGRSIPNSVAVECNVHVEMIDSDGERVTRSIDINSTGGELINIDPNATDIAIRGRYTDMATKMTYVGYWTRPTLTAGQSIVIVLTHYSYLTL